MCRVEIGGGEGVRDAILDDAGDMLAGRSMCAACNWLV